MTNKEARKAQWNSVDGFETLLAQLTKGIIFTAYVGAPISDVDVVGYGNGQHFINMIVCRRVQNLVQQSTKPKNVHNVQSILGKSSAHQKVHDEDSRVNGLWY